MGHGAEAAFGVRRSAFGFRRTVISAGLGQKVGME